MFTPEVSSSLSPRSRELVSESPPVGSRAAREKEEREGETLVKTTKKCSKISSSLENYVIDSCLLTDILKQQYMQHTLSGTGSLDNYVVSQTVNLIIASTNCLAQFPGVSSISSKSSNAVGNQSMKSWDGRRNWKLRQYNTTHLSPW